MLELLVELRVLIARAGCGGDSSGAGFVLGLRQHAHERGLAREAVAWLMVICHM